MRPAGQRLLRRRNGHSVSQRRVLRPRDEQVRRQRHPLPKWGPVPRVAHRHLPGVRGDERRKHPVLHGDTAVRQQWVLRRYEQHLLREQHAVFKRRRGLLEWVVPGVWDGPAGVLRRQLLLERGVLRHGRRQPVHRERQSVHERHVRQRNLPDLRRQHGELLPGLGLLERRLLRHERQVRCEYRDVHERGHVQQRDVHAAVRRNGPNVLRGKHVQQRRVLPDRRGGYRYLRCPAGGMQREYWEDVLGGHLRNVRSPHGELLLLHRNSQPVLERVRQHHRHV